MTRLASATAIAAAALSAAAFAASPRAMAASYLFAWLFILGLSLGAMAILMMHALTGGEWGAFVQAPLLAATRTLPLVALLFLPVLAGAAWLYPWASMEMTPAHNGWWLNRGFFSARSVAYLLLWVLLSSAWLRARERASVSPAALHGWSAAGLIVYTLTVSLAAVDWIASLMPDWYASGFGLVVGVGQMLGAMAFAVAVAGLGRAPDTEPPAEQRRVDLGNLMLMFVLTWTYLAFVQFLIIWMGDLPREIAWYVPRLQTSWLWLGAFLVVFHFFVPLAILLSRAAKSAPGRLGAIALSLLAAHLADVFWLVVPSLRTGGLQLVYTDAVAVLALGAVWLAAWKRAASAPGLFPGAAHD